MSERSTSELRPAPDLKVSASYVSSPPLMDRTLSHQPRRHGQGT